MANIYLAFEARTDGYPFARRDYERLLAFSRTDSIKRHGLVDDPNAADFIAFIGSSLPNFSDVRSSVLYKKYKSKSVLFYSGDKSIPIMPGVYTCLEKRWFSRFIKGIRSGFYLRVAENESMDLSGKIEEARYLFSFVGSSQNHPVRKKICQLQSDRAFIKDTSDERAQADGVAGENIERGLRYRKTVEQSKFILCPAGKGISSWRLFETMRAGRVPVVIADHWVPGDGPPWSEFSIFVAEKDVNRLSEILEQQEAKATAMGAAARQAWEKYYSKATAFSTSMDLLEEAFIEAQSENRLLNAFCFLQYLEPFFLRHWVFSPLKQILEKTKVRRKTSRLR